MEKAMVGFQTKVVSKPTYPCPGWIRQAWQDRHDPGFALSSMRQKDQRTVGTGPVSPEDLLHQSGFGSLAHRAEPSTLTKKA